MYKKIFALIIFFCTVQIGSFANEISASLNKIINSFDFDRDSVVAISVRDKKTGSNIFGKGQYKYLNPASALKLFTVAASINTLGENYSFDTAFYIDKNNNLYLKLSGDPLLSTDDLNILAKNLKANYKGRIKKIYIDDSIIDFVPYPDGWTIDDFWPNSPKISPYMVDNNTVSFDILLSGENSIKIIQKNSYKFPFVNKLVLSDKTNIKFVQNNTYNTIDIEGTISDSAVNNNLPVINPKQFFCLKLNKALDDNGIRFSEKFLFSRVPKDARIVAKFSRPIKDVAKHTLTTSDNTAAEMMFKVAGGKFAKETSPVKEDITMTSYGTTENGVSMFYDYYNKLGLDISKIKIRDGSGASRYNALNTEWMTDALLKLNLNLDEYLPTSGEGTLSKRMRELKDKVRFKTGTLNGISSLVGEIKAGENEYYYASIIMSYDRNNSSIKGVEDEMIYEIYRINKNE